MAAASETEFPELYEELRSLAASQLGRERQGHTLQPTALVHEAWIRLGARQGVRDREHFLALAARIMRNVLVDHARRRGAARRGGGAERVTLFDAPGDCDTERSFDLLAVEDAMVGLQQVNERLMKVAELRLFGGLTARESADVLGLSETTAEDDWAMARAWLTRALAS